MKSGTLLQVIAATASGIWIGVASVRAYDPRLDEALAALQKAAALVEASSPQGPPRTPVPALSEADSGLAHARAKPRDRETGHPDRQANGSGLASRVDGTRNQVVPSR